MNKRVEKYISVITCILLCAVMLFGSKESELKTASIESITYNDIALFPGYNRVYVISSDEITYYDLTDYWENHSYDYFEDSLPPEGTYYSRSYKINEEQWNFLVNNMKKNKYNQISKNLSANGFDDGGYSYIEVKTDKNSYFFGGFAPEKGYLISNNRFKRISRCIEYVVSEVR